VMFGATWRERGKQEDWNYELGKQESRKWKEIRRIRLVISSSCFPAFLINKSSSSKVSRVEAAATSRQRVDQDCTAVVRRRNSFSLGIVGASRTSIFANWRHPFVTLPKRMWAWFSMAQDWRSANGRMD